MCIYIYIYCIYIYIYVYMFVCTYVYNLSDEGYWHIVTNRLAYCS